MRETDKLNATQLSAEILEKEQTKMSTNELVSTIKELRELKTLASDLEAEITALEDVVKAHMGNQEQLKAGEYKITYKPVKSARLDGKALKSVLPDIATRFTVQTEYRRLVIA